MKVNRADVDRLTKKLMDEGKFVEAGWMGLRLMSVPPSAPEVQVTEMRQAFFAGAQHVFHGLTGSGLDEDAEPTAADMQRMENIDKELREFIREFEKKHGIKAR